jgi:hypothetical protein
MSAPIKLSEWYATDEDVASLAGGDFAIIVPKDVVAAYGKDGIIALNSPWTLTSASNVFDTQGVTSNMVVQLLEASTGLYGSGILMAVDSASGGTLTMRRLGQAAGWGYPPIPGGANSIEFVVATLANQLEDVANALHEKYGLDPNIVNRRPTDVYDLRVFRRLTVYETVRRQYVSLNRTKVGNFVEKIDHYWAAFQAELNQVIVRWGPTGQQQQPTTRLSTRLSR